jgi:hypothetical protein
MAAAIGAGLPITEPSGNMIVDIGGGTTEVAVISLAGIVYSEVDPRRRRRDGRGHHPVHQAQVQPAHRRAHRRGHQEGDRLGYPLDEPLTMEVKGRDLVGCAQDPDDQLRGDPRGAARAGQRHRRRGPHTLERTPPELSADIVDKGIVLAGGGALLRGLDQLLAKETGLHVRLRDTLAFVRANPDLSLLPATVLQRSKGMLTLDIGSMHGVKPSMCAITKDGIVGIVTLVEPTMSFVASLHHEHCRIGARAGRTRAYGVVQGSGNDVQRICDFRYVNLQDDIRPGDEVVSAGGNVFPAELPIGRLITVQNDGDLYRKAVVRPYANPYAVDEVLLVRAAQQDVTAMAAAEPIGMHAMPDDRTIQERFAP